MSLLSSKLNLQRLAVRLLVVASAAVCVMAALSLTATDTTTSQLFDRLHWTVAYVTAALLAWLGVWHRECDEGR
jgi:hypothetical protein